MRQKILSPRSVTPALRPLFAVVTWILLVGLLALTCLLLRPPAGAAQEGQRPATQQVWTVCPAGPPDCDYASVQDAVDAASRGDRIKVAEGLYTGVDSRPAPPGYTFTSTTVIVTQVVYVTKTVSIEGGYTVDNWDVPDPAAHPATLDAGGQGRVLFVGGPISPTIEGLSLTGGDATGLWGSMFGHSGAGVFVMTATATISNCRIYSNTAATDVTGSGGGIHLFKSPSILIGNVIVSNTASLMQGWGGGLELWESDATLTNNLVQGNRAGIGLNGWGGGLVSYWGAPRLTGNTIRANVAGGEAGYVAYGGGIYLYESDATLVDNAFEGNVASEAPSGYGGGLFLDRSDAMLTGNRIADNLACTGIDPGGGEGYGGGVYVDDGAPTLLGNTVHGNVASTSPESGGYGGGVALSNCHSRLEANTIVSNTAGTGAGWGGGAYLRGSRAQLIANTIASNTASLSDAGFGGGVSANMGGHPNLISNTITANTAGMVEGFGGGVDLDNTPANLRANTIEGNFACIHGQGWGGGLYVILGQNVTVHRNWVLRNTATLNPTAEGYGGGVCVRYDAGVRFTNDVVAGNHASTGSALWFGSLQGHPVTGRLAHATIADNVGAGAGVHVASYASVAMTNTIVAGHDDAGVYAASGGAASLQATLWHANQVDTAGPGTLVTGTVNVYGDPAFVSPSTDYHLGASSAAVNAGVDINVRTDIDGDLRPMGAGWDIGADELPISLDLYKRAATNPVAAGAPLTYALHLTNTGEITLTATVTDLLPSHVAPAGVLTWTVPGLPPGQAWAASFAVTVETGYIGSITNVVHASSIEGAAGSYTSVVTVREAISGLTALNDSPTTLGHATTLTATVAAGSPVSYTWGFGDGALGAGAVITHTYPRPGTYTAVVTAADPVSRLTATTTVVVTTPFRFVYLPVVIKNP